MKKLLLFFTVTLLTFSAFGQVKWTNGNSTGLWEDDANWDAGFFPSFAGDEAMFEGSTSDATCLVVGDQQAGLLTIGVGGVAYSTVTIQNGSSLTIIGPRWSAVGWSNEATLVVEANAKLQTRSHLWLGFNPGAKSFIELHGTIEVGGVEVTDSEGNVTISSGMFGINFEDLANADSEAKLKIHNGGHLKLSQLTDAASSPNNSFNGITGDGAVEVLAGGKITLPGDRSGDFAAYATAGKILTPGGQPNITYDADADLTTFESDAPLSTDRFSSVAFEAYPNPSSDIVYISSKRAIAKVTISNILGQTVLQEKETATLNIANLKAGQYILTVEDTDGNIGNKKIIKQ